MRWHGHVGLARTWKEIFLAYFKGLSGREKGKSWKISVTSSGNPAGIQTRYVSLPNKREEIHRYTNLLSGEVNNVK
jgi:hypothetical protein